MIYEMRTYRLRTGTVPAYLKLVEEEGIAIQKEIWASSSAISSRKSARSTRSCTSGLLRISMIANGAVPPDSAISAGWTSYPGSRP